MSRRRRAFTALASVAGVVAAMFALEGARSVSGVASPAAGCSLLVNQSASQCATTADCLALGPAFAGSFCSGGVCALTCASNHDCSANGTVGPRICRPDHTCADVLSVDCRRVLAEPGDFDDDSLLLLGLIAPLDPATLLLSEAKIDAADLARRDFLTAAGGLPPVTDGGAARHFAFVVCDESVDHNRAAIHLTDDLHVPAIIGPVYSGDLVSVATNVTLRRGALLISPSATSTFITDLPHKNGLVWRTAPSDTEQAEAIALLVRDVLEPQIKPTLDGGALRVGVAYKGDSYGVGMAGALDGLLVFNGKGTAANGADYGAFNYGEEAIAADGGDAGPLYAQAVTALRALEPHVVILVGTREAVTNVLGPLEAAGSGTIKPRYLLSDGTYPVPELLAAVEGKDDLRQRILGTTPGTDSMTYQTFVDYYVGNVHDGTVPIESTAATYDATYMLAYAAATLGATVTGAGLSRAFARLVSPEDGGGPPKVDVDPLAIDQTLTDLAAGADVHLNGASGPLDFDLTTGDTRTDIQVWCLRAGADAGSAAFETTSVYYGALTHVLERLDGSVVCP